MNWLAPATRRFDSLATDRISPWCYVVLRAGIATLLLYRHGGEVFASLHPDHLAWTSGWEFSRAPAWASPLLPGLDRLLPASALLAALRTGAALLLLLSLFPRASALVLALSSWLLMAGDRFRYFHHLELLYESALVLVLAPGHTWKALREHASVARWPLWAIRAHACGVYWAAGLAKCSPAWWSGATLDELHRLGLTSGGLWELARRAVGTQPLAIAACSLELALPALLWIPKTRTLGLVCALALHLGIESSMMVSTFGATMLVLLTSFLPWESTETSTHRPAVPGSAATSLGQRHQPR